MLLRILLSSWFCYSLTFSAVHWDEARRKAKRLVMKNHKALTNYKEARRYLLQKVHLEKDRRGYFIKDSYCLEKQRKSVGPNKMPNHRILNVEHTWPQSRFNKSRDRYLQKADLHHLYPTNSDANSSRASYYFADLSDGDELMDCEDSRMGIVPGSHREGFEPPRAHKGNVARALFYFSIRYDIEIPDFEERVLITWHREDPVDSYEMSRNNSIASIQGNRNPFIDNESLVYSISNF